jgi:biotin/methionine sulfoxide reductase
MSERLVRTASHWGAFWVEVRDGRAVGVKPFEKDEHPSPLAQSQVAAVYDKSRVDRPHVRKGFLERGAASDRTGRGAEPFVPVDWDTALDLVARELKRVKESFGNRAIFAGSYGWSSAGRLHHAKSLLARFMNLHGGATVQVDTYSNAAGSVITPHVLGDTTAISGPGTTFATIADHTRLVVSFGGMPLKNLQIDSGGTGEHSSISSISALAGRGIEFVNISPLRTDQAGALEAEWLPAIPGTDTAIMMGLAHTLVAEGLHDQAFLERYTVGFDRFRRYLMGEDDGQPKDAAWAARICGIDAETIRKLARRMGGTRTFITTTWSLQRADHGEQPIWMTVVLAAILGQIGLPGGGFGFGYGSMNRMGQGRSPVAALNRPVDSALCEAEADGMSWASCSIGWGRSSPKGATSTRSSPQARAATSPTSSGSSTRPCRLAVRSRRHTSCVSPQYADARTAIGKSCIATPTLIPKVILLVARLLDLANPSNKEGP